MIGQLAVGITTWVFNLVVLSRMGVDGMAAYTILGYVCFVQMMIVTGFAIGLGPFVGYSFGAGKIDHMNRVMRIALISGFITGAICWVAELFSSAAIAASFSPGNMGIWISYPLAELVTLFFAIFFMKRARVCDRESKNL